jgi:hypothetical protein
MSQSERRLEILDLLARGKITLEDAARLLDDSGAEAAGKPIPGAEEETAVSPAALKAEEAEAFIAVDELPPALPGSGQQPRWLRIRVAELDSGKNKVTVNIPFGMVKFGMARVFSPKAESIDLEGLSDMFHNAAPGMLVDVQDEEDNEHVRIYLE